MATEPKTISLTDTPAEDAATQAREALRNGGIIAFPTETVYGLAIRGDRPEVYDALFELKQRDPNQKLARYVAHSDQVIQTGVPARMRAAKLMRAFWPGPVTIVIETADGETHGFRASSHPVAALMGADDNLPVFGTSANLSGSPPIAEAQEIIDTFGDRIALTIDQGRPLSGLASTVVLLPYQGGFKILRQGDIDAGLLRSELATRICLVCTGNTCRSPMAAVILRKLLASYCAPGAEPVEYIVFSGGTSAGIGAPASAHSQTVAAERGLDLSSHASRPVSAHDLNDCDLILTMTRSHRDMLVGVLPECENRIRPLAGEDRDVADPFGGDLATYRQCADEIESRLKTLLEEL